MEENKEQSMQDIVKYIYTKATPIKDITQKLKDHLKAVRERFFIKDQTGSNLIHHICLVYQETDTDDFMDITKLITKEILKRPKLQVDQSGETMVENFTASFNAVQSTNHTPIQILAKSKKPKLIETLLKVMSALVCEKKLKVNAQDRAGRTFLHLLAYADMHDEAYHLYLKFKGSYDFKINDITDNKGMTLFHLIHTAVKNDKTMLKQALNQNNLPKFKEYFDQIQKGSRHVLPGEFDLDVLGHGFLHDLIFTQNSAKFLDIFFKFENHKQVFGVPLQELVNRQSKDTGMTPFTLTCSIGSSDMINVFMGIQESGLVKLNFESTDARERSIFISIIQNNKLTTKFKIDFYLKLKSIVSEDQMYELMSNLDKDGFSSLTALLSQATPQLEMEDEFQTLLSHILEFSQAEMFTPPPGYKGFFTYPLAPCIKLGLIKSMEKIMEKAKIRTFFVENNGMTSIEYAFDQNNVDLLKLVLSNADFDHFLTRESIQAPQCLFDMVERIYKSLKSEERWEVPQIPPQEQEDQEEVKHLEEADKAKDGDIKKEGEEVQDKGDAKIKISEASIKETVVEKEEGQMETAMFNEDVQDEIMDLYKNFTNQIFLIKTLKYKGEDKLVTDLLMDADWKSNQHHPDEPCEDELPVWKGMPKKIREKAKLRLEQKKDKRSSKSVPTLHFGKRILETSFKNDNEHTFKYMLSLLSGSLECSKLCDFVFKCIQQKKESSTFNALMEVMQECKLDQTQIKEQMLDLIYDTSFDGDFKSTNPLPFDHMDFYQFYTKVFETSLAHPELTIYTCFFHEILNLISSLGEAGQLTVTDLKVYDKLVFLVLMTNSPHSFSGNLTNNSQYKQINFNHAAHQLCKFYKQHSIELPILDVKAPYNKLFYHAIMGDQFQIVSDIMDNFRSTFESNHEAVKLHIYEQFNNRVPNEGEGEGDGEGEGGGGGYSDREDYESAQEKFYDKMMTQFHSVFNFQVDKLVDVRGHETCIENILMNMIGFGCMGYINFEQVEGKHPTIPIKNRSLLWFLIRDARGFANLTRQNNKNTYNKRSSNVICYLASDRKRLPTFKYVFSSYQPITTCNEYRRVESYSYRRNDSSTKFCPFLLACKKKNYEAAEIILQRMSLKPEIALIVNHIDTVCDNKDILIRLLKAMVCDEEAAVKCLKENVQNSSSRFFYTSEMNGDDYYDEGEGDSDSKDPQVNKFLPQVIYYRYAYFTYAWPKQFIKGGYNTGDTNEYLDILDHLNTMPDAKLVNLLFFQSGVYILDEIAAKLFTLDEIKMLNEEHGYEIGKWITNKEGESRNYYRNAPKYTRLTKKALAQNVMKQMETYDHENTYRRADNKEERKVARVQDRFLKREKQSLYFEHRVHEKVEMTYGLKYALFYRSDDQALQQYFFDRLLADYQQLELFAPEVFFTCVLRLGFGHKFTKQIYHKYYQYLKSSESQGRAKFQVEPEPIDLDNFVYCDFENSFINYKFVNIPTEEANLVYPLNTRLLIWYDLLKKLVEDRNNKAYVDLVTTISRHLTAYYDPIKQENEAAYQDEDEDEEGEYGGGGGGGGGGGDDDKKEHPGKDLIKDKDQQEYVAVFWKDLVKLIFSHAMKREEFVKYLACTFLHSAPYWKQFNLKLFEIKFIKYDQIQNKARPNEDDQFRRQIFQDLFSEDKQYFMTPLESIVWNINQTGHEEINKGVEAEPNEANVHLAMEILKEADKDGGNHKLLIGDDKVLRHQFFIMREYASDDLYQQWLLFLQKRLKDQGIVDTLLDYYNPILSSKAKLPERK